MFEKATRMKLRFLHRGQISVEDLWDCNPEELNGIYRTLSASKKAEDEGSLFDTSTKENERLKLQMDLVKHVFDTKKTEADARLLASERRRKKQQIMEIIATKQTADLQGKSIEDLQKMMDELD